MKTLRYAGSSALIVAALQSLPGQSQTTNLVNTGSLTSTGDLYIDGNVVNFGTQGADQGFAMLYTPGASAKIDFQSLLPAAEWTWAQNTSPQMKLTSANALKLFQSGSTAASIHVVGSHANGVMADANNRPSIAATGAYPQLVLMAGGSNNANHGSSIFLGSFDTGTSGAHKHWSIGTSGQNSTFLDFGYSATDINPHAGIRNHNGTTVMSLYNNGNVGIGTGTSVPAAKLQVNGSISASSTISAPTLSATTLKATNLQTLGGLAVATTASDGKLNLSNGLAIGTNPAATLTPNSTAYLNQTLTNLGFRETPVNATPVNVIATTGFVNFTNVTQNSAFVYVIGYAASNSTIGGHYIQSNGAFVAKLSQSGATQWVTSIGSSQNYSWLNALTVDSTGNVIAVGTCTGATFIAPTSPTNAGGRDAYIIKLNASGVAQWDKRVGGADWHDSFSSVSVDSAGNIIAVGNFLGTTSGLASNLTSNGTNTDAMVVKYDTNGQSLWARRVGGSSSDRFNSVVAEGGDIYAVGDFSGTTTGLSQSSQNLSSAGGTDAMIIKYNSAGISEWSRRFGGPGYDAYNSVSLAGDGSIGGYWVTAGGQFTGTANGFYGAVYTLTSAGGTDGFVAPYSFDGMTDDVIQIGGPSDDSVKSVTNFQGNVYAFGEFSGTTTGLYPANLTSSSSGSTSSAFALRLVPGYYAYDKATIIPKLSSSVFSALSVGTTVWLVGSNDYGPAQSLGDIRVTGSFAASWSGIPDFTLITPEAPVASNLAWGGSAAKNNGVALGASAYAEGTGSVALGSGTATGAQSFAIGESAKASGEHSIALGGGSRSEGWHSFAVGNSSYAAGSGSVAMGISSAATGYGAFAVGESSTASGNGASALGWSQATGEASAAIGSSNAMANFSSAMGASMASGEYSTAMNYSTASGSFATSMGEQTNAQAKSLSVNRDDLSPSDQRRREMKQADV